MRTRCSCPDWANPCKHIAAVHYLLGERFDEDPFLMFLLRGRSQDEIVAALRARRAGPETEAAPEVEQVDEPDIADVLERAAADRRGRAALRAARVGRAGGQAPGPAAASCATRRRSPRRWSGCTSRSANTRCCWRWATATRSLG